LLKLDNARLRLSRWGEAVRLDGEAANVQSLEPTALSAEDVPTVERLLGQILELFADAEGVSAESKSCAVAGDSSLMVPDAQTDLDPVHQTLHEKMRNLSIRRQNRTPLLQKVKWALYQKKHFKRLIEDVIGLVNALVETFPAVRQAQRDLCTVEASEIGTNEAIPVLENIAASQGQELQVAISTVLKSNVSFCSKNASSNGSLSFRAA
jgi:hypothetical protein